MCGDTLKGNQVGDIKGKTITTTFIRCWLESSCVVSAAKVVLETSP